MYSVSGWLILVLLPHYKKGNYSIIKIELFPFRNLTTLENTCLWIYWPENYMNTRNIKFWGSYIFVHQSHSVSSLLRCRESFRLSPSTRPSTQMSASAWKNTSSFVTRSEMVFQQHVPVNHLKPKVALLSS